MYEAQIVLGLLVVVAALVTLARRMELPYPILLVAGGLVLGFIPGLPRVELKPELVFLLFLPPLLYSEALSASIRDFKANTISIGLLSIGLVLATTVVVGVVAHSAIGGLTWAGSFVLGAIVAPTDTVAATAITQRIRVPRRILTVLEGESLINDATALVTYRMAVAAVVSGSFSVWEAGLRFLLVAAGGVAIGLAVGWCVAWVRAHLDDPSVETTISFLTAFAAYLPADALGVSGVLAVVAAGLYLGWRGPNIVSSSTRLQAEASWETLVFLLNGLLFILVGLQLHRILDALSSRSAAALLWYGALVSLAVILVRLIWVFPGAYLPRLLVRSVRERNPYPPWQNVTVMGWTGMRGAASLAAALAIPATTNAGMPFPGRDLIIYLTFSVILATLLLQGLSLPWLIRRLGVHADNLAEQEETKARLKAAKAAMARLEQLSSEPWAHPDLVEHIRSHYDDRRRRFAAAYHGADDDGLEERDGSYQRLQRELLQAERFEVIRLRNTGIINDEVMHRLQHEIDLEDVRLGT